MKKLLVVFSLVTSLSAMADSESGDIVSAYQCGLVKGLLSSAKVAYARTSVVGYVELYRTVVGIKYKEGNTLQEELRKASKMVRHPHLEMSLSLLADDIYSSLDDFSGDVDVFSRKLTELDNVFYRAITRLKKISTVTCKNVNL